MNFKPIFYINGILLLTLSVAMLFPALVDLAHDHHDWKVFAGSQIITAFVGFALIFSSRQKKFSMNLRETFVMTSLSWVTLAFFAAIPFSLSEANLSFTKAFFEAMSGITTTGATVISGLDTMAPGILLWRAILHWIGGIGFLIIALAVLPLLQISGMQIYKTQSFSDVDKVMPSASQMAVGILIIYIFFTILCSVILHFAGMSGFDAICHSMSAVATGGFANYDASIGHFKSPLIDTICMVFMVLGALPFVLYIRAFKGDILTLFRDSQVKAYFSIIICLSLLAAAYLILTGQQGVTEALRNGFFTIITLMTTTGFASGDYTLWGPFIVALAFLATFLGSCSGSTSGGIKIFRLQILWKMLQQQARKLITPHGIFQVQYNGKVVEPNVQASVAGFFFLYIASWIIFSILLQMTGLDFMTAFTGAITALSNVGPGLGHIIGPAGNFSAIDHEALWILSLAMLMGRVEFFTLLVLLMPGFWRD